VTRTTWRSPASSASRSSSTVGIRSTFDLEGELAGPAEALLAEEVGEDDRDLLGVGDELGPRPAALPVDGQLAVTTADEVALPASARGEHELALVGVAAHGHGVGAARPATGHVEQHELLAEDAVDPGRQHPPEDRVEDLEERLRRRLHLDGRRALCC
jgi:hypothetical protein